MQRRFSAFVAVVAVVLILSFALFKGWLSFFEEFLRGVIDTGSGSLYQASLQIKDANLEQECEELCLVKQAELEQLKDENVELRALLGFFDSDESSLIGAQVTGRSIDPIGTTVIINKGRQDNISVHRPVIARNGILIGHIAEVHDDSALVRLINDNESKVAVTVLNTDRSIGLVEGGYGVSVSMNFIPQNEILHQGDIVVTSGLQEAIPKGLVIGTIDVIEKKPHEPFQRAIVSPAVDLDRLSIVAVISEEE